MTGEARSSATVVLVRQGAVMPEVLMVRRHAKTAFGANYAFPGGVVDRCDCEVHARCQGPSASEADRRLSVDRNGLDYYSAAIRELFEETGVLLARDVDRQWAFDDPAGRETLRDLRRGLNDGSLMWPGMLRDHELGLASDTLEYFAHWITPVSEPKRFSTRFFVAEIPDDQEASHDGAELTDSQWMTAREVLRANKSGQMKIMFPTFTTLEAIADFSTTGDVLAWARNEGEQGVVALRPAIVSKDGRQTVVLPDEPGYPTDRGY